MNKSAIQKLEFLWHVAIKARANFKSELSNLTSDVAHHIIGKTNLWLRLSLENGIALTNWEHENLAHGKENEFEEKLKLLRGEHCLTKLQMDYKWKKGTPDIEKKYVELMNEIVPKYKELMLWLDKKAYKTPELISKYKALLHEIKTYNPNAPTITEEFTWD